MDTPYNYLYQNKGKNVRLNFTKKLYHYFNVPKKYYKDIDMFEKFHCYTLLIDDIQDNSTSRRGKRCSHLVHGIPWTIASSLTKYHELIQTIMVNYPTSISKIMIDNLYKAHTAQLQEIYFRDNKDSIDQITLNHYREIVKGKTTLLFESICAVAEQLGERDAPPALYSIINDLGLLFQIKDDFLNLTDQRMFSLKGFAEDLDEQKLSYLVIQYYQNADPDSKLQFKTLFYQKTKSVADKKKLIYLMKAEIVECQRYLIQLRTRIEANIKHHSLEPIFEEFTNNLLSTPVDFKLNIEAPKNSHLETILRISRKHIVKANILSFFAFSLINNKWYSNTVIFICAILSNLGIQSLNQLSDVKIDLISKPYLPLASKQVSKKEIEELLHNKIAEFRKKMTTRELEIFDLRIFSDTPVTLQEIGDRYGISRERVRQVEKNIIKNILIK